MNSTQLYEEVKNSLLVEVDGVEEVTVTKKGLWVVMEDKKIFLVNVSRIDDDEEEIGEDEDEDLDDDEDN
jgi:hypothetical protein